MPRLSVCPDRSVIESLATAPPTAVDRELVLEHLEVCERCAAIAEQMPADGLTNLIRNGDTVHGDAEETRIGELVERFTKLKPASAAGAKASAAGTDVWTCPSCQKNLRFKPEHRGKKIRCKGCGQVAVIPHSADRTSAPAAPGRTFAKSENAGEQTAAFSFRANDEENDDGPDLTSFLAPPQAPDELGRLGKYRILSVLGHGGMGVVFKGEDVGLQRLVAIKVMLPTIAGGANARKRFTREAQTMAKVESDHVVRVYQVDSDRGVPYLAMEFLKGEPLDKRLEREPVLAPAEAMRIGREMAEGLAAAHALGLVHRDIKPANVWLEVPRGRVKILDFGLARAADESSGLTQTGAVVGTPSYMAPEQSRGEAVDGRCDLWSLGVALYRICTGKLAFQGRDSVSTLMAIALNDPPTPREINAGVPAALSELIMSLMQKDPAKRPSSAADVVERIRALEASSTVTAKPSPAPDTSPPSKKAPFRPTVAAPPARSRRWLAIAAAGLFALLVIAGGVILLRPTGSQGEFRVETDDDAIAVALDEQGGIKLIERKTGATYLVKARQSQKLPIGEYDLDVTDGASGLTFSAREFTLTPKDTSSVRVSYRPIAAPAANFALEVTSSSKLTMKVGSGDRVIDFARPFTIEMLASSRFKKPIVLLGCANHFSLGANKNPDGSFHSWNVTLGSPNKGIARLYSPEAAKSDEFARFAVTGDGTTCRLFVNGKMVHSAALPEGLGKSFAATQFNIGGQGGIEFTGVVDDIRFSNVCRYTSDYKPVRPEKDADTVALYLCDEGKGNVLTDSSGNEFHGKVEGVKWVDNSSTTDNYALATGLHTTCLGGPPPGKGAIDYSLPFTIEAWARPESRIRTQWVISRIPGIGLGLIKGPNRPDPVWFCQLGHPKTMLSLYSKEPVMLDQPVRLAISSDGKSLRLFVDGKLTDSGPIPTDLPSKFIGSEFDIGGKPGARFTGLIDDIRISRVCRYTTDYKPSRPEKDADTVVLYHFDEGKGETLVDSSGNGFHGSAEAAKWISRRDSEANSLAGTSNAGNLAIQIRQNLGHGAVLDDKGVSFSALTMEGYFTLHAEGSGDSRFVLATSPLVGFSYSSSKHQLGFAGALPPLSLPHDGQRVHIAYVLEGPRRQVFLNGSRVIDATPKNTPVTFPLEKISIGGAGLNMEADEVRISKVARYHADFVPRPHFETDADTIALYHCDEGKGDTLVDSSGNGRHINLRSPQWVPAGAELTDRKNIRDKEPNKSPLTVPEKWAADLALIGWDDPAKAPSELARVFGRTFAKGAVVVALEKSPDDRRLYHATNADKTIRVWNLGTGTEYAELRKAFPLEIKSVCLSGDGKRLAYATASGPGAEFGVCDAETGAVACSLASQETAAITALALSPDGSKLVAAASAPGPEKSVKVWDVAQGKFLLALEDPESFVTHLAYSPDGKTIAGLTKQFKVELWDAATGKKERTLEVDNAKGGANYALTFSKDGARLAVRGASRLAVFDRSGAVVSSIALTDAGQNIAFSPDARWLTTLYVGSPGFVNFVDATNGKRVRQITTYATVRSVFSADGETLFVAHTSGLLSAYRLKSRP